MRTIYGILGGLAAGYVTSRLLAPHNGEVTRNKIVKSTARPIKDVRMNANKLAYKLGLISELKKAELNKATVESYNAKIKQPVQQRADQRYIADAHERSAATKAVMSSTDKAHLRGVPVKAM